MNDVLSSWENLNESSVQVGDFLCKKELRSYDIVFKIDKFKNGRKIDCSECFPTINPSNCIELSIEEIDGKFVIFRLLRQGGVSAYYEEYVHFKRDNPPVVGCTRCGGVGTINYPGNDICAGCSGSGRATMPLR